MSGMLTPNLLSPAEIYKWVESHPYLKEELASTFFLHVKRGGNVEEDYFLKYAFLHKYFPFPIQVNPEFPLPSEDCFDRETLFVAPFPNGKHFLCFPYFQPKENMQRHVFYDSAIKMDLETLNNSASIIISADGPFLSLLRVIFPEKTLRLLKSDSFFSGFIKRETNNYVNYRNSRITETHETNNFLDDPVIDLHQALRHESPFWRKQFSQDGLIELAWLHCVTSPSCENWVHFLQNHNSPDALELHESPQILIEMFQIWLLGLNACNFPKTKDPFSIDMDLEFCNYNNAKRAKIDTSLCPQNNILITTTLESFLTDDDHHAQGISSVLPTNNIESDVSSTTTNDLIKTGDLINKKDLIAKNGTQINATMQNKNYLNKSLSEDKSNNLVTEDVILDGVVKMNSPYVVDLK